MGTRAPSRARVDVRAWPGVDSIAHLVLLDVSMVPDAAEVDRWVREVFDADPDVESIRTGALFPAAAAAFRDRGFDVADRLALLERPLAPAEPLPRLDRRTDVALRPLRRRDLADAAVIDGASFPIGWQNDASTLDDIRKATPSARARRVVDRSGRSRADLGFAITGIAAGTGYLQRIAVAPAARRRGIGALLVDDALRWLARRGAHRALVNTGTDNVAALELYRSRGFDRLADELVVLERRR